MAKTNTGLIAYAQGQLGRPYWYGCYGQISTKKLYQEKKRQYPGQYPPAKWTEKSFMDELNVKVHDCVGLIKGYVMGDGDPDKATPYNGKYDVSANGLFSRCIEVGPISTIPEIPGLVVWKNQHIGIYIGGGYAIEARGHAYGVVKTKVTERPWMQWGRLPADWIQYEESEETCMVELPILKRGMKDKNGSVTSWQSLMRFYNYTDASGKLIDVDGSFGPKCEEGTKNVQNKHGLPQTGIVDAATWRALIV